MFSFRMNDRKLIELVKAQRALYDYRSTLYSDYNLKRAIWAKIGEDLKQPASLCKTRWNNIRDNYRKTLKKLPSGEEVASRTKKYRFAEMLHFLDDQFQDRESSAASDYEVKVKEEVEDLWTDQDISVENVGLKIELIEDPEEINGSVFDQPDRDNPKFSMRRRFLTQNGGNHFMNTGYTFDGVDAFLGAIAPTLKTFGPYYLNIAKSKIFSIVQEYEMKIILEQQEKDKEPVTVTSGQRNQTAGSPHSSNSEPEKVCE